ncbi:23482_t:CDS:2, partial [Gigaspora rosea]
DSIFKYTSKAFYSYAQASNKGILMKYWIYIKEYAQEKSVYNLYQEIIENEDVSSTKNKDIDSTEDGNTSSTEDENVDFTNYGC